MIVTVQCSHYILNACNNTNCQWSKPQTIQIETRPGGRQPCTECNKMMGCMDCDASKNQ